MLRRWEKTGVRFVVGALVLVGAGIVISVTAMAGSGDDLPGPAIEDLKADDSNDLGHICTLIGCSPGVGVIMKRLPPDARTLEICKESKCISAPVHWRKRFTALHLNRKDAPGSPLVTVWVLNEQGSVLAHAAARPAMRRRQPNGPNCPPPCWQAWLRYDGRNHALTQIPVPG